MTINSSRPVPAHVAGLFALILGGCGGGGGSAPVPPPPPAPEAAYVVTGVAQAPDSQGKPHFVVRVFDPANPATELLHDDIEPTPGESGTVVATSDETSWDPATHTVTTLGHARAYYTNHGQLWAIDLRGDHDHAPRRIGSEDALCAPYSAQALSRDGQDAWVLLTRSVGGQCVGVAAMRADGPTAGTVVPFPSDTLRQQFVESADGRFGGILGSLLDTANSTQTYWFADAATMHWTMLDAGVTPTDVFTAAIAPDPAHPGAGYLALPGGIFAASWDDAGLAIGARVAAVDQPAGMAVLGGALNFADGANYMALDAGGSPVVRATAPTGQVFDAASVAGSGLVLGLRGVDDSFDGTTAAAFLDAGSGGFAPLALAGARLGSPLGGRGDVTLLGEEDVARGDRGFARHSAADGVEALPQALLVVTAGMHAAGAPPDVAGTLQCPRTVSPSGAELVFCAAGALSEEDLVTRDSTALGALPDNAMLVAGPTLVQGVATVLGIPIAVANQPAVTELFLVVPGQANSLVRLTNGGN